MGAANVQLAPASPPPGWVILGSGRFVDTTTSQRSVELSAYRPIVGRGIRWAVACVAR